MLLKFVSFLTILPYLYAKVDPILYCDLCRGIIAETRVAISKVKPDAKARITQGQGRLTSDGKLKTKSKLIPLFKSRDWLEEVLEDKVCKNMADDYVKWFDGKNKKQWRVGRIMTYDNQMNTNIDMGFLQSGQGEAREVMEKDPNDRTRTIRWYCENAIELMEEELFSVFTNEENIENPTEQICGEMMSWCEGRDVSEAFTGSEKKKSDKQIQRENDREHGIKMEEDDLDSKDEL